MRKSWESGSCPLLPRALSNRREPQWCSSMHRQCAKFFLVTSGMGWKSFLHGRLERARLLSLALPVIQGREQKTRDLLLWIVFLPAQPVRSEGSVEVTGLPCTAGWISLWVIEDVGSSWVTMAFASCDAWEASGKHGTCASSLHAVDFRPWFQRNELKGGIW